MTSVPTACAELVADAKYLTAVAAAGFTSLTSIAAFDNNKLVAGAFPDSGAVQAFTDLLTAQDGTIKKTEAADIHVITQIVMFCAAAFKTPVVPVAPVPPASAIFAPQLSTQAQAEKERADNDAFGVTAYANVAARTLAVWPLKLQAPGKDVRKAREDLNRGVLSKETVQLKLQKNVLSTEEEKTALISSSLTLHIGDAPAPVAMTRSGQFLSQLNIFDGKMTAAGLCPVAPHTSTPGVGSGGTKARLTVPDPAGGPNAKRSETWHILPTTLLKYRAGATDASWFYNQGQLNAIHEAFHERAQSFMAESNFNYASALEAVMEVHTWHSILASLPAAERGEALTTTRPAGLPGAAAAGSAAASDELRELRAEKKRLNNELEQARSSARKRKVELPPAEPRVEQRGEGCRDFQRNKCTYGASCKFKHACEKCGSASHGAADCRR